MTVANPDFELRGGGTVIFLLGLSAFLPSVFFSFSRHRVLVSSFSFETVAQSDQFNLPVQGFVTL